MSATRPPLSERDWAQLSAYLDGALGARERAALERRLAAEPHLRQALDELRETVALLRALPTLRAPRDFTLDPALYGRARRRWWSAAAALQLSGALGTALAIVLIVLGMFAPARRTAQVSAPATSVALQATVAPSETPTLHPLPTVAATSAPPAADALDAEAFGEVADETGAANAAESAPPQALFAAPVGGAAEEAEAAPPPAPVMREPVEQATPTVAPSPTPSATASATPSATPSVTPAPTEERQKITPPTSAEESRPRWWLVLAGSVTLLASIGLLWLGKRRA